MNLIACQFDIQWENRSANFDRVDQLLESSPPPAGSLIALPEMFSSGFSMNVDRIAEEDPSPAEAFLKKIATQYHCAVLGGLARKLPSGSGSNELAVFGPDGHSIGRYQKNHCFSYTGESDHYESGNNILVFDWGGFRVCPVICYDLRFPELFRRGVALGANLFVVIANWPEARIHHWETLLTARAIENQAVVLGVNRVGSDPKFKYTGASRIVDVHGRTLAQADDDEQILSAEVDIDSVVDWRNVFPALKDIK